MKIFTTILFFLLGFWYAAVGREGEPLVYPGHSPIVQGFVNQVNSDSIRSYMHSLQDFGSRFCLVNNRRNVAERIKDKFESFGIENVLLDSFELRMTFMGQLHETWQYNVVATLPGNKNEERVYILGAHHDSVCYDSSSSTPWQCSLTSAPGADDNASGVAAALEVARVMKANGYHPSYTIKFVTFAAEEVGLRGAWDFANKAANAGMDIRAMINNDMISNSTEAPPIWTLQVHEYPNAKWLADLATSIASSYTSLNVVVTNQYINATDSWAFHQNDFPSLFLHEEQFSPFYHSANDLVDNTNKQYAAEVTKVSLAILLHLNGINGGSFVTELGDGVLNAQVFPNPINQKARVRLSLTEPQTVSIRVFDVMGSLVLEQIPIRLNPGNQQIEIDTSSIKNGLYLFEIRGQKGSITIKALKNNL